MTPENKVDESDVAIKPGNVVRICGVVAVLLLTAGLINYTNKAIIRSDKVKLVTQNFIYDPDHNIDITPICLYSDCPYRTTYARSECNNKTLFHWFNPWLRHSIWKKFRRSEEKKRKARATDTAEKIQTGNAGTENNVEETDARSGKAKLGGESSREKSRELLYSVLVGMLVLSALTAVWEVFKDKYRRGSDGDPGHKTNPEKECSLADFTMNRHLRKEMKQQGSGSSSSNSSSSTSHLQRQASFEVPAKVTQTLIHQSSLDRAFPKTISEVNNEDPRRFSVPSSYLGMNERTRNPSLSATSRKSLDVPLEEGSPGERRKSRHFIRRH